MKHYCTLLLLCSALNSNAWFSSGIVYCDTTTNGVIDVGDFPIQNVLVVVTNTSGTFSNAGWTAYDGSFLVNLPDAPDHYVNYLLPLTLPAGAVVIPAFNSFQTTSNQIVVSNNFLVQNLICAPPTPILKFGHVYCDANTNGLIDAADVPVQSALVVVTNVSGTFSNAGWTTAEGWFLVDLPNGADTYVDYVHPLTLPSGTTAVLPVVNTFVVTNSTTVTNDFLLENPACAVSFPPPFKIGHVYCDANTNRRVDPCDVPICGALVVVTNFSGTFSNAAYTDAKGSFSIQLAPVADLYGDYLVAASLSAGSAIVIPGENQVFQFSIPTAYPSNIVTNDYLVQNLDCVPAPPPPPKNGHGWLTGGGTIKNGKGKSLHSFGGVVNPGCKESAEGGNWNETDFCQKLQFKGLTIEVVDFGVTTEEVSGSGPDNKGSGNKGNKGSDDKGNKGSDNKGNKGSGNKDSDKNDSGNKGGKKDSRKKDSQSSVSSFSFIEFQGTGTLKGIGKNKVNYGTVQFFARAEDVDEPGHKTDRLYLRVFNSAGTTLLLISADSPNPLNVAPVTICTGNLQMHPCK